MSEYEGSGGGFRPRRTFAPVKVGDELDVKIEAVGEKGDGIAKKNGFVLFVPNTREGDDVHIKVTRVLRKVGFAEVTGEALKSPESSESKPEEAPAEQAYEEPAEEEPYTEPEGNPEDSEDFGEDDETK